MLDLDQFQFSKNLQLRHQQVLLNNSDEEIAKLYTWWELNPAVKSLEDVDEWIYEGKSIRLTIIRFLKHGLDELTSDNIGDTNLKHKKRHVFHPRELLEVLNYILDIDVKLPNLYFHIGVLEDHGLIVPVNTLSDGRYDLTYYGRSAKLFLFRTSNNEMDQVLSEKEKLIQDICGFVNILGLNYDRNQIRSYISRYLTNRTEYEQTILKILENNGEILDKNDINVSRLFVFLTHIFVTEEISNLRDNIFQNHY